MTYSSAGMACLSIRHYGFEWEKISLHFALSFLYLLFETFAVVIVTTKHWHLMKKLFVVALLIYATSSTAQNFQLHYDMGAGRHYFTSTFEIFTPDEYGSTFAFIDMDYDSPGNKSVWVGYFEIACYISLPFLKSISATLQYNDGVAVWGPLGHTWLAGISFPLHLPLVTLYTDVLYRRDYSFPGHAVQLTFVWSKSYAKNRLHFMGYMDVWSKPLPDGGGETGVQAEPQIWLSLNKHLLVGGEAEISRNFLPTDKWEFMPT